MKTNDFVGKWTLEGTDGGWYIAKDGNPLIAFVSETPQAIRNQILEFCKVAANVQIRTFGEGFPPQVFVAIDSDQLREKTSTPSTVCTVEIAHKKDEKLCRGSLAIGHNSASRPVFHLSAVRNNDNLSRTLTGVFVDYNNPKDD